ncbi:unnamed protein product (macronuclear) [Paramecium tetraurelia]|uniref:phosphoenolpyruvate carboxykinase (ATP) n=1 Tax=Paramecium tetraurelia TaxID=5888 RepID=A0CGG4_PARTE|nr:uncharacterized protein GSPATT00007321001 [Paramecium tetraurelia]CAK69881.1 unnamed protein product [Paramecium tetraurelia]|eukprot:XP_001437278.1 hypothetical protein (macronuclear) [Paramecium tetraurelia strain d4-2]
MENQTIQVQEFLTKWGLRNATVYRNPSVPLIYELSMSQPQSEDPTVRPDSINNTGALVAYSGKKCGRVPKDKRIIKDEVTERDVWWGDVNIGLSQDSYNEVEKIALEYLNNKEKLFIIDGYAGWDVNYRLRIRVFCTRPYHALFMKNMLIRPTDEELKKDFSGDVDFYIFNAGPQTIQKPIEGIKSEGCVAVNLTERKMVILGTQYAGEMKKGVFGVTHYLFPKQGILTLHSSANEGENGDVTLLFGLSGTGKTTLSADPKRRLIGDDEHAWSDNGIFNIEGGCYAKCVDLSKEKEPEIYNAVRFGAVLENIEYYSEEKREVDYTNISITENTRVSYPLDYIPGAKFPAQGGHPKNIFFLTCDAYGVLPPVSMLTPEQAMYHFISGYTAKVAGTEVGVKEPQATFSACFGEAFLALHPTLYANMLAEKIKKYDTKVWLINTGWSGGKYGVGQRMSLKYTRGIIDLIHSGELKDAEFENFPIFNFAIPKTAKNIPTQILNPKNTWKNPEEFDKQVLELAEKFQINFKKYEDKATQEVINAGPKF